LGLQAPEQAYFPGLWSRHQEATPAPGPSSYRLPWRVGADVL